MLLDSTVGRLRGPRMPAALLPVSSGTPLTRRPCQVLLAVLLGAALAVGLSGCGEDPEVLARTHFNQATEFFAKDDPRSAVIELKSALQAAPDHAEARHLLGRIYLAAGTGVAAQKELDRARSLGQKHPDLNYHIARSLLLQGEFAKALQAVEQEAGAENEARWLVLFGDAKLGTGDREASRAAFESALSVNPAAAGAQRGLARLSLLDGEPAKAERAIEQALKTEADDIETWLLKGELEISLDRFDDALASFEKAQKISANNPVVLLGLARAHLGLEQPERAAKALAPLAKAAPKDPRVNYVRALIARQDKNLDQAEKHLRDVLLVAPSHSAALLLLGQTKYLRRDFDQAAAFLAQHVGLSPGNLSARKLLGAVYVELKDPDAAIRVLAPVQLATPNDPQLLAMLGTAYMTRGNATRGKEYLDRAAKAAPDTAPIRAQLAVSHLATGATSDAIAELEAAVEIDPDFSRADVLLILTHFQTRNFDRALEAAGKLVEKQPDAPAAQNLLGAAYEGKGDRVQARLAYQKALTLGPDYVAAELNLARMDLQDKKLGPAQDRYQAVLEKSPDHPVALVAMAKIATDEGRGEEGVQLLERARTANEKALEPRLILANYYLRKGERNQALVVSQEAERISPKHPGVMLALGKAQMGARQVDDAVITLVELTRIDPASVDAHLTLAQAWGRKGKPHKARESLDKVLELAPGNIVAKAALASIGLHGDPEQRQQALDIARELQQSQPDAAVGFVLEGDSLATGKKFVQAMKLYEQAMAVQPSTGIMLKLYAATRRSGAPEQASALLADWVQQHPDDAVARVSLASDEHQAGSKESAMREYEEVLKSQPGSVLALNNLAWLYYERNDPRAIDLAKQAHDALPHRPEIMDTYGWLLVEGGQVERGLKLLSRAAEARPDNGDIVYHHAAALSRAGDRYRARKVLEQLLVGSQEFPERPAAEALLKTL